MQLDAFQKEALNNVTNTLKTFKSVLLQSATGSGKTVIASFFVKQEKKKNFLILVNRQALVTQFFGTLKQVGINSSVLHDEITRDKDGNRLQLNWKNNVQITMPVTFINTMNGENLLEFDSNWEPDYIIIDEAHKGTSLFYQIIRDRFKDAKILGLTATPYRDQNDEGEDLTEWYGDRLITTISVKELIKLGRCVQPIYYSFDTDAHIVNTWLKTTPNKKTIVFSKDTQHSFELQKAFLNEGIKAEVITAGSEVHDVTQQTPLQRQAIYKDFEHGDTTVLISVNALCEGFDVPCAEVCILARSVSNHAFYHQMIGRVIRSYYSKIYGYVLDFGGNIDSYGHIEDYQWCLEASNPDNEKVKKDSSINIDTYKKRDGLFYTCHNCNHVYNIKTHNACNQCSSVHTINIKTTVFDEIRKLFPVSDNKELDAYKSRFKAAATVDMARELINKKTGHNIFDVESGKINEKYQYIVDLLTKKNGGDEVNVKVLDNGVISVIL